uniref:Uncharacterized protein n=1 Tax=Chromera velia CCMP2878 TaxID=1169474 RepID=A0A0G4F603_9ALVE|eukprot:Cvel_15282.t1-p1 / transcript=Cvel_15282.t1 / gene=Cvel_15282 / organism=Chromera_velia_CCMP2878 / gene_product=hypothetical protein / transcript_product=hypothetical protein / location=Cvel_scaffold1121:30877-35291(-) / protein_length=705 / sequence_SO=supercontig / SO=protein_coding / is_pseudo=false
MRKVKAENGLLHRRLRSAGINDCRYLDAVEKNRAAALIQNKVRQKLAKVTATRLAGEIVLAYRPGTLENESRPLSNSELVFKLQKKLHMRGLTLESAFRAADRGASGMLRVSDYLAFLHRVAKISLRLSEMLQILGLLRSPTGIYRLQNIAAGAASSGAQSSPGRKIDPSGRSKRKIVQEDADVQRRKARAADLLQRPGDFPEAEKKVRDLLEGEASLLAFTFDKCEQLAYAFGRSELEILSLHESEERERETGSGDMTTTGRMRDSPSPLVGGGFTNSSAEGQGMEILGRVQRATEPSSPSKSASKRDLHQLPLDDQGEKRMEESQQIQKAILPFLSHDDLKKFNTTQTGDGKGTLLLEGSFHFTEKDGAASRQIGTPAVLELTAALQDKFVQRPDGDSSTGGGGGFSWSVLVDSAERGRLKADADRLAARVVRLRNEARDRNSASSSPGGLPEDPEMAVREARRLRTLCEKLDSTDVFTKVSSASLATHLKTIRQAAPPVTIFAALRTVEYMDDDLQRLVDTAADPLQTSPRAASTSAHDHLSNHHAAGGGGAGGAVEGAGEGSQAQGGSSAWGGMIPGRRASVTSNLPYRAPHIPPLKLPAAANNSANDNTRGWQASAALPGGGAEFGGPTVGFRDSVLPTFGQRQSALLQAMNSPAPGLATGGAGLHADGGSYRGSVRGGTPVHPSPQSGPLSSPLTGPTW